MIRSKLFWTAAIMLAVIPLLCIDIAEHRLAWEKDVREEMINVVQNVYELSREQKAHILDNILERNHTLNMLIYLKSFLVLALLIGGVWLLIKYKRQSGKIAKPLVFTLVLMVLFTGAKFGIALTLNPQNQKIKFISIDDRETDINNVITQNFKGKVVYIDFWGTTCGPCLAEFRDFTKPLKEKYRQSGKIGYLYISQGNEYLWRKQVAKYDVEGTHLFLSGEQYDKLYHNAVQNKLAQIAMPTYVIVNAQGEIVETDAKRPSDSKALFAQLDKYLQ
ncbi:redoxin family protein [Mucilaginibacter sp. UR6-1]|uniref:TlpA family protein disulfide reductase n=1 Tax=Mucilaginibacter sp. UR6-1 TaxID=1435643 RepID=UPI001E2B766A|nr:redoxin family protein [Mucilaginibacter sp. UR6-1]MCC8409704.1 redoxin family protein [Mucilaginibacter sp. UR6-1]